MRKIATLAAVLAASSLGVGAPAQAAGGCWGPQAVNAAKLRNLDIMLMVTGLRCRMGPDNFQPDYYAFSAAHQSELNAANEVLRVELGNAGPRGAVGALDRMSTSIANAYGNGHPQLGCRELKEVARNLAQARSPGTLLAAANTLVGAPAVAPGACAARVATVRR
jgi:hypothetical protein